jgi:ethanolamine utilization protein EutP
VVKKSMMHKVTFNEMVSVAEAKPWRFMLVGGVGAGKTTLIHALESKKTGHARKTQMIDYSGWGIDTPGEFVEMGYLRRVLVSTSFDAQLLVAVQDATRADSNFPPNYFLMFPQHTIGVLTKLDSPQANIEQATTLLRTAGVTGEMFLVSALTGLGIPELRDYLMNQNNVS